MSQALIEVIVFGKLLSIQYIVLKHFHDFMGLPSFVFYLFLIFDVEELIDGGLEAAVQCLIKEKQVELNFDLFRIIY